MFIIVYVSIVCGSRAVRKDMLPLLHFGASSHTSFAASAGVAAHTAHEHLSSITIVASNGHVPEGRGLFGRGQGLFCIMTQSWQIRTQKRSNCARAVAS